MTASAPDRRERGGSGRAPARQASGASHQSGWNFADVFEALADRQPDALAQRSGGRSTTWAEFDRRADGVAAALLAAGVVEQDKVAQYLYNSPPYLESTLGAFKAGLATVNTNYRYTADELTHLWDNADVVAVVFDATFTRTVDELRARLPGIRTWLWVDDGSGPCPEWAVDYESAAAAPPADRVVAPWGRSADHLLLLYTGGTTGTPKGVMWRQGDLFGALDTANKKRLPPEQDLDAAAERVVKPGPRNLPAAPLMHGTGLFNALSNLMVGGSVITMEGRRFDPVELLATVQHERINSMSIVGDAFAKPILRVLDADPRRWDISSLRVIVSSGVIWSAESKAGLLRHNDRLIMVDSLGSSEAIGMASSTVSTQGAAATASFQLGASTRVVAEDGRDVIPGSGQRGLVAMRGYTPIGYYKDPDKSAATFRVIEGQRYSIPGDFATVHADGTVRLLGRGSQCINTGGEKVYPEEVEEVLKLHPTVADAAVVGVPDERFGEAITALVEPHAGDVVDEAVLIAHVKEHLAGYKAPKRVLRIESIGRAANGKLDYRALKAVATS
ncbi:MAG: AMP-binding protein [Ilumatobacteraceae bacterium]